MNQQKNQGGNNSLLDGIQQEVSPENAPLLNFITRHAPTIAGIVLAILLVMGGWMIWNWYHSGKQKETREELARINMELKGKDRDEALTKLAENAPESVKLFIYMSLGQSAQENNNPVLAADAYAKAAKIDGDGPLGLTAALGSVGSLLMQAEYEQAFVLLKELEEKLPQSAKSVQLQQMLAEAAAKSGRKELAIKTYENLANTVTTPQAAYFRSRAEALTEEINQEKSAPAAKTN